MRNYKNIRGNECLSSCLIAYLNAKGINLNESDIFLCGDGYRVSYSGNICDIKIGADAYEAVFRFLKKYKIRYHKGRMNKDNAYEMLKKMCAKCIFIRVQCGYLTYHKVFETIQSPHWITVLDWEDGKFLISDNAIPDRKESVFLGMVSEQELLTAWKETGFEYLLLSEDFEVLKNQIDMIKKTAKEKLQKGIKDYFLGKKKFLSDVKTGKNAIPQLLKDYQNLKLTDREIALSLVQEMNYQVRIGGCVTYKKVIFSKMNELGIDRTICEEYGQIIQSWDKLFLNLLKAAIKCDEKLVEKLVEESKILVKKEEELAHRMKKI